MKKLLITAAAAAMAIPVWAMADSGPGCGVGTQIFKGQSGIFAHTVAATTNGTLVNQWFGLTSGTLGCDPQSVVSNEYQRQMFVASNMDNLTREMAQGSGDHLVSLASLMGIDATDRGEFYALTKAKLPVLMQAPNTGAKELLAALDSAMLTDANLAKYVR